VASPNSCVADKNSPVVTPASAPAWHRSTSTQTRFIRDRSITRPPSQTPWPATLWPPLRTATVTRSLRANLMALTTSETSAHRTIKVGCLSIIPFHTWRALLYSSSAGRRSLPRKRARNSLFNGTTAAIFILHRGTLHRTVRTKDAAVTGLRAQQCLAVRAFVEKLACVGRHRFSFCEAANGTHQNGFEKNFAHTQFTSVPRAAVWELSSWFLPWPR